MINILDMANQKQQGFNKEQKTKELKRDHIPGNDRNILGSVNLPCRGDVSAWQPIQCLT